MDVRVDHKESWVPKNWCFWTVVLEKTLESPLDCKEIKPVNPKGNQSWIFIGRTDGEAETPILWPSDAKNWLIGKDPDAGKDWRQEEKGMTEDETVGCHHRLNGHESEQALGVGDEQGSLACYSPQGHQESDTTEWVNWTEHTGFMLKSKLWFKNLPKNKSPEPDSFTADWSRANADPSETLSKNHKGRNTPKLIIQVHHHHDTKTRQRHHKIRKLQANITEHRHKNPQH